jgi:hypothetical protein
MRRSQPQHVLDRVDAYEVYRSHRTDPCVQALARRGSGWLAATSRADLQAEGRATCSLCQDLTLTHKGVLNDISHFARVPY